MELELVEAYCVVCKKVFKYFGKPQYHCSTFCKDREEKSKDGSKVWRRETTNLLNNLKKEKQEKERPTGTVVRGEALKVSLERESLNVRSKKEETQAQNVSMKKRDTGLTLSTGNMSRSSEERVTTETQKKETERETSTGSITLIKKEKQQEEGDLQMTQPQESRLQLSCSQKELSTSMTQLEESSQLLMKSIREASTLKDQKLVIACAKELRENLRTRLECTRFVFDVHKENKKLESKSENR